MNTALEKDPENHEFLLQRSLIYLSQKKYDKTIKDMTKSLEHKPNDPKVLYRRGEAYYLSKEFKLALEDFYNALDNEPYSSYEPDIYYHIGLCYANLEEFELSIEPYSKAIEMCEDEPVYYHERAKALLLVGNHPNLLLDEYEASVKDYNDVIKMQPYNAHAYFGRAFAFKNMNEYSKAVNLDPLI